MMNTQTAAKWFAGVLMVIGILGFIPGIVNQASYLFGIISVNTIFNLIYIISGMAAWFSAETYTASKIFFKIVGPIFLILAILGMIGHGTLLNIFPNNIGDTILHIVFAFYALLYGYGTMYTPSTAAPSTV
jgi:hypothetical protein